jgi:hypothetical protein
VDGSEPTLEALAQCLVRVAATVDEPRIARRLIEMANEVLRLVAREAADSSVYDSATFFLHTGSLDKAADPNANSSSPLPAQRH